MHVHQAIGIARHDAHRLNRFTDRRRRFLDALDWDALPEQTAREASMLDELLETDLAKSSAYVDWLEGCVAVGVADILGVVRFEPGPHPWHKDWITLA